MMLKAFYRRNLPHLQRDCKPHFLTFCTYRRWVLPDWAQDTVLQSCLHEDHVKIELHAVAVMPDHAHLIFTPLAANLVTCSLAEITKAIKGASSHLINRKLGRRGRVWQEESFDRVLRGSERLREKIEYVVNNPVRAGIVGRAGDYRWLWVSAGIDLDIVPRKPC
ncbi:MAG: transposase [Terriglobales bacterium]